MVCVAASLIVATAGAQPAPTDGPVQEFVADYAKAWNAGNVEALNRIWTENGELIDAQGVSVDRKTLMTNRLAKSDGARPVLSIDLEKVRLLEPNVAMVEGESKLAAPGGSVLQQTRFSGVLVKQDGAWRIRLIRQLSTRGQRQESPDEPLKEVAWMVGDWVGVGDGIRVYTSTKWDLDKRYIVSRFEYEPEGGAPYKAEVRAGWDPQTQAMTSWYFDSRGTISTTIWAKNGDHWLGSITGTRNDGEGFTGTLAITQLDNDSYLRTLTNVKVGSETMPDQEVHVFRVPEQPDE